MIEDDAAWLASLADQTAGVAVQSCPATAFGDPWLLALVDGVRPHWCFTASV